MPPHALAQWHAIVRSRDIAALDALLADDVVFHSPVVFRAQDGKAATKVYLAAALEVLGNETFHYVGEWVGADSAVLEFVTTVDRVEINGVDLIAWNAAGLVTRFKVMARPLKAIHLLQQKMAAQLEKAGGA
jgi:hypothetical protein